MNRVSVIGTSGSGKSTLAHRLADVLSLPCVELDAIHWRQGDWTPLPQDEFREAVAEAVRKERWVVEGGYSAVRALVWERADTVVWLDYPLPVTFGRLLRRTARRVASKEQLWGGNRESISLALSRESILLWCLQTHRPNRRKYSEQLAWPENQHLRVLRFQSPRQADKWLAELAKSVATAEEQPAPCPT